MVYPMDTIRRRMMISKMSTFTVMKGILKNEGVHGLYKGAAANALRYQTNALMAI